MRQGVYQYHDEVAHGVESRRAHVQDPVIGVVVEGVPVRVTWQVLVGGNLVGEEYGHWRVTTSRGNKLRDEAAELVDNEWAGVERVEVDWFEFSILPPLCILRILVTLTYMCTIHT